MRGRTMGAVGAAVCAVLLAGGCGGGATDPAPVVPAGTYALVAVDAAALPALLVQSDLATTTVERGALVVRADGRAWIERTLRTVTPNGIDTGPVSGSVPGWLRVEGAVLVFTPDAGTVLPPEVRGTREAAGVILPIEGRQYRFHGP